MLRKCLSNLEPLIFVRHGQTDWNVAHRFQGHVDTSLNATGRSQAEVLSGLVNGILSGSSHAGCLSLFCSPLERTRETAKIVIDGLSCPILEITADTRLMEQNYGQWEGLTHDEVRLRFPGEMEQRARHPLDFAPSNGESLRSVSARMENFLTGLSCPCIVVTHSGNIVALKHLLSDIDEQDLLKTPIRQDAAYFYAHGVLTQWTAGDRHDSRRL